MINIYRKITRDLLQKKIIWARFRQTNCSSPAIDDTLIILQTAMGESHHDRNRLVINYRCEHKEDLRWI